MQQDLAKWLASVEWYDNSTLTKILNCPRLAFYSKIYQGGLSSGVGQAALFGSSIHEALSRYYNLHGKQPESNRRAEAFRYFARKYESLFTAIAESDVDAKYTLANGADILDNYFDSFLSEDSQWIPIENELAFVIKIEPEEGDPVDFVEPFYYVCRADGLWERRANGDLFIKETKTTGGGVDRRLLALKMDRQTMGYTYCANRFGPRKVEGVLADVLLVATKTRQARREVYYRSEKQQRDWRVQTIRIIQAWRTRKASLAASRNLEEGLNVFEQNTDHCTTYGQCGFYKLCYQSPHLIEGYEQNTWNPFSTD